MTRGVGSSILLIGTVALEIGAVVVAPPLRRLANRTSDLLRIFRICYRYKHRQHLRAQDMVGSCRADLRKPRRCLRAGELQDRRRIFIAKQHALGNADRPAQHGRNRCRYLLPPLIGKGRGFDSAEDCCTAPSLRQILLGARGKGDVRVVRLFAGLAPGYQAVIHQHETDGIRNLGANSGEYNLARYCLHHPCNGYAQGSSHKARAILHNNDSSIVRVGDALTRFRTLLYDLNRHRLTGHDFGLRVGRSLGNAHRPHRRADLLREQKSGPPVRNLYHPIAKRFPDSLRAARVVGERDDGIRMAVRDGLRGQECVQQGLNRAARIGRRRLTVGEVGDHLVVAHVLAQFGGQCVLHANSGEVPALDRPQVGAAPLNAQHVGIAAPEVRLPELKRRVAAAPEHQISLRAHQPGHIDQLVDGRHVLRF